MRRPTKRQVLLSVLASVLAAVAVVAVGLGSYRAGYRDSFNHDYKQFATNSTYATLEACRAADRLNAETGDWHTPTRVLAHYERHVGAINAPGVDPELQASVEKFIGAYSEAMFWQGVDAWGDPRPQPTPAAGVTAPDEQEPRPQPTPAASAEQEKVRAAAAMDVEDAIKRGREAIAEGNAVCVATSDWLLHHK